MVLVILIWLFSTFVDGSLTAANTTPKKHDLTRYTCDLLLRNLRLARKTAAEGAPVILYEPLPTNPRGVADHGVERPSELAAAAIEALLTFGPRSSDPLGDEMVKIFDEEADGTTKDANGIEFKRVIKREHLLMMDRMIELLYRHPLENEELLPLLAAFGVLIGDPRVETHSFMGWFERALERLPGKSKPQFMEAMGELIVAFAILGSLTLDSEIVFSRESHDERGQSLSPQPDFLIRTKSDQKIKILAEVKYLPTFRNTTEILRMVNKAGQKFSRQDEWKAPDKTRPIRRDVIGLKVELFRVRIDLSDPQKPRAFKIDKLGNEIPNSEVDITDEDEAFDIMLDTLPVDFREISKDPKIKKIAVVVMGQIPNEQVLTRLEKLLKDQRPKSPLTNVLIISGLGTKIAEFALD